MKELCIQLLEEKGATLEKMADILLEIQKDYYPNLTRSICVENILAVLSKREAQHAILTGIEIDRLVEEKQFREPIQSIIETDAGLYGIDEILALSIVNIYGSIGFTNFGFLDKTKPGIIKELDGKKEGVCSTFIDDLVCAIIASAASRLAHSS
ncbi:MULTISPECIES: phosphatidylglycerophosphatase A family protein [Bacillus cereus group]|uniref:Phosphatidylglycerophosphatase A n=2 Tax=Bacillus cereus group TaxID=86661 RepID=A0A9X6WHP0_BACTU|nr:MULTISPECIES: phosphatidylglycerophosphatase A [Bacillus cereus group]MDA1674795.1 phosphatidylglycerophosphatase A [Bacillus cereus group sp. TH152-1LC]PDZ93996.1 phosphatidylglycerophosphatase A [Bacillus cereus]PFJ29164.1 phosphatidylglycerophosphatase A [Bacillus thuringiensis]